MDVLVIGGGGREHAIVWSLAKSNRIEKIYCIPGNAGISEIAECVYDIQANDIPAILSFVEQHPEIKITVVAPDDPLAGGLVDRLTERGFRAFGPVQAAAKLESSKAYAKEFMKNHNIPTAAYEVFENFAEARYYAANAKYPLVIKADGLALGKGVVICNTKEEAEDTLIELMEHKIFGESGSRVVIEEFLTGKEMTILCFTDGKVMIPMASAQDYKKVFDGNKGPNTGGMGAISPCPIFTDSIKRQFEANIMLPTLRALQKEEIDFKGVLYFGLMLTASGLKVIEYNARFGDPETQVILPRLKTELIEIVDAVIDERLGSLNIEWDDNAAVCAVVCSEGYPGMIEKGMEIKLDDIDTDITLFHSGTIVKSGVLVTNGGRVIGVMARGKNVDRARAAVYKNITRIKFKGAHFRTDIGR